MQHVTWAACLGGMKIILTNPHHPYLQKTCPQNMPYNGGLYGIKSVTINGFLQKYGLRTPKIWHANPPFMPYEPFLLGVGVVFNLLKNGCNFFAYVGSFLLTVELSYLQLKIWAFCLQLELFCSQLQLFYLQLELFRLQWESASNNGLKGV